MLPSLENLRCFLSAARLLNFSKAARPLGITPAAFGQRIRQLEMELGAPLFRRTTRSVTLTDAGMALVPHAEKCIAAASDCVRAVHGEMGPATVELTLGTRWELGMSWIMPQLEGLSKAMPWMQLHLYFGSGSDLLLRVRTMEVDCAVTSTRLEDPKLDSLRLHREDYAFCGARTLLRRQPLTRVEHALSHVLIDHGPELPLFRYWRDASGGGDRLRFQRIACLGSINAIRDRVADGAGVAVLPRYLIRRELASGTFQEIFKSVTPLHDYFRLVFRMDDPRRSVFESLARVLHEAPLQ
ncbi:LysR family transcriptional regulator [Pendulispora albinea]|uniref:LysR substrate-binding domain-containing protein n=1 Tax=Pendulispora albinea TaxID=2741071 RepID=A0ABZ2LKZ1_9BACT